MKKFFPLLLLSFIIVSGAQAQKRKPVPPKPKAPVVTLGKIPATRTEKGIQYPTPTTFRDVLDNSRLIAGNGDCEVVGFMFSLGYGEDRYDHTYGPIAIQGDQLTEEVRNKIKEFDHKDCRIYLDHIVVRCNGQKLEARPVVLQYDHR